MRTGSIQDIKKDLYLRDVLHSDAEFACYSDGVFTYHIVNDNICHEINIINEDLYFFRTERLLDLIDDISNVYVSHRVFLVKNEDETDLIYDGFTYVSEDDDEDIIRISFEVEYVEEDIEEEKELLEKIKYLVSAGNDSQAVRLIEQYGFKKQGGYE